MIVAYELSIAELLCTTMHYLLCFLLLSAMLRWRTPPGEGFPAHRKFSLGEIFHEVLCLWLKSLVPFSEKVLTCSWTSSQNKFWGHHDDGIPCWRAKGQCVISCPLDSNFLGQQRYNMIYRNHELSPRLDADHADFQLDHQSNVQLPILSSLLSGWGTSVYFISSEDLATLGGHLGNRGAERSTRLILVFSESAWRIPRASHELLFHGWESSGSPSPCARRDTATRFVFL